MYNDLHGEENVTCRANKSCLIYTYLTRIHFFYPHSICHSAYAMLIKNRLFQFQAKVISCTRMKSTWAVIDLYIHVYIRGSKLVANATKVV